MICPTCEGPATETHSPDGIYGRCLKPWDECQGEYATAYDPNENTAPALDGNEAASALDEHPSVYTTAPDPDGWSTTDQIEWMESYR